MFDFSRKTAFGVRLVSAVALVTFPTAWAARGEMIDLGYEFRMAANLGVLEKPDDPVAAMLAAWQTQHDLQIARNMPFAELVNTSQMETTEIKMFRMTVGDVDHQFDWVRVVDASPGVTVSVHLIDTVEQGLAGDELQLEFENFRPGDFVRFQLDLDPDHDDMFPLSDFRTVLFDANGDDATDNATLETIFHDAQAVDEVSLLGQLSDYHIDGPLFVGPAFHNYSVMDHVTIFPASQTGQVELATSIPEPSAWVLLMSALGGLAWTRVGRAIGGAATSKTSVT